MTTNVLWLELELEVCPPFNHIVIVSCLLAAPRYDSLSSPAVPPPPIRVITTPPCPSSFAAVPLF